MKLWLQFWSIDFAKPCNTRTGILKMKLWLQFWSIDFAKLRNTRTGFSKMKLWLQFLLLQGGAADAAFEEAQIGLKVALGGFGRKS